MSNKIYVFFSTARDMKTIFFSSHDVSKPDSGSYLSEVRNVLHPNLVFHCSTYLGLPSQVGARGVFPALVYLDSLSSSALNLFKAKKNLVNYVGISCVFAMQ